MATGLSTIAHRSGLALIDLGYCFCQGCDCVLPFSSLISQLFSLLRLQAVIRVSKQAAYYKAKAAWSIRSGGGEHWKGYKSDCRLRRLLPKIEKGSRPPDLTKPRPRPRPGSQNLSYGAGLEYWKFESPAKIVSGIFPPSRSCRFGARIITSASTSKQGKQGCVPLCFREKKSYELDRSRPVQAQPNSVVAASSTCDIAVSRVQHGTVAVAVARQFQFRNPPQSTTIHNSPTHLRQVCICGCGCGCSCSCSCSPRDPDPSQSVGPAVHLLEDGRF